ncbi:AAA family ATPase [Haloferula sp. BvORR071]|uniref:phosphotransferase-like protein n=1 Tax=Haloferula sp. BvORR071 TaxID=1396141 RepID=UPI000697D609|nr:AAA family ATPase [Haloferula sp. BvORR071]
MASKFRQEKYSTMTPASKLIILEGPSGSGKSSLAAALQESLLPGIWLGFSMDTLIYTLPPSVLHRCNTANDWSGVDGRAIGAAALACLRALVECGNKVIFDLCIPSRQYADTFQAGIQDLSPVKVGVRCDWQEIERRTRHRADRSIEEAERTFKHQHPFPDYDFMIDTTGIGPDAAAMECLASFRHLLDGPGPTGSAPQADAEQGGGNSPV